MFSAESHRNPWLRSSALQEVCQPHAGSALALRRGRLAALTCEACLRVLRTLLPSQTMVTFLSLPAAASGVSAASLWVHVDVSGLHPPTRCPQTFFFFCTCPEVTSTVPFPGTCHLAASFPSFLADFTVSVFLPSLCPYPADPSVPVYTQHLPSWALDVCSLPTSPFHLPAHHHLDLLHLKGRSDSSCHISP